MATLIIDCDAERELDAIYDVNEDAAALIDVLLEALGDNEGTLDELFRPGQRYKHEPSFEVKRFEALQRNGKNIFTIKTWDEDGALLPYRVLFAHHAQIDTFYVLAIRSRDEAYDLRNPEFNHLLDRYERHGVPTYKY